jgi:hypothetical protein
VSFHFVKPRREQVIPLAALVVASLGLVVAAGDVAGAAGARSERLIASVAARAAGEPVMAIVSLRRQQITIYDTAGWILRAPVSTGQSGRETPAGVFSVIQKEAEHYSNLYDDAYMPHMQRLTWSGIALHGGVVPTHPASHGCIRLLYEFAERLFDIASLGMRVIVAPADVAPVSIVHPALFQPKADAGAVAAARVVEAEGATKKADEARLVVFKVSRLAAQAMVPVRVAENLKLRAEAQLEATERALASASSAEAKEQSEDARVKAATLAIELSTRLATAKAELQPKLDAVGLAREAAAAAEARARLRARRPARRRDTSNQYRCSSAARPSTFMSVRALNQSSTSPSQSETRIVQSARMSLPLRSMLDAISICDGAWSRWLADSRMRAGAIRIIPRAGTVVESRSLATSVVPKKRSTEFRYPRRRWIASLRRSRRDLP